LFNSASALLNLAVAEDVSSMFVVMVLSPFAAASIPINLKAFSIPFDTVSTTSPSFSKPSARPSTKNSAIGSTVLRTPLIMPLKTFITPDNAAAPSSVLLSDSENNLNTPTIEPTAKAIPPITAPIGVSKNFIAAIVAFPKPLATPLSP